MTIEELIIKLQSMPPLATVEIMVGEPGGECRDADDISLSDDGESVLISAYVPDSGPDEGKTAWDSDEKYTREDWQAEVSAGDTNRGYWDWVNACRERDQDDEEDLGLCERCGKPATAETLDDETLCSECGADVEEEDDE